MATAFRIILDGSQEVPSVSTTAAGLGIAFFDDVETSLSYLIDVDGLDFGTLFDGGVSETGNPDDDVTGAHIHNAARGSNGGVQFNMFTQDADDFMQFENADDSRTLVGSWETTDPASTSISTFASMLGNAVPGSDVDLYINIHTTGNTGGDIRGQFVAISDDNANTVTGTAAEDVLPGLGGNDTIDGLGGNDALFGGAGADMLIGGLGNDELFGETGNDTLVGGIGNDILDGGFSADDLSGGAGNDILFGGFGDDIIDGGTGDDTADYSGFGGGVIVNLNLTTSQDTNAAGNDTITLVENVIGGDFNDRLTGRATDGDLDGGAGSDFLFGLGGNDVLDGGDGNDNVQGGNGDDTLLGENGIDTLLGGGGMDVLTGGDGNDQLRGGNDSDTLTGGLGRDVLIGGDAVAGGFPGDGAGDTFVFNAVEESSLGGATRDIIRDFDVGLDTIKLDAIDAASGGANNAFTFIGSADFSMTAGELRAFNSGANTVVRGDVDGDGVGDLEIFLNGNLALTAGDFIL